MPFGSVYPLSRTGSMMSAPKTPAMGGPVMRQPDGMIDPEDASQSMMARYPGADPQMMVTEAMRLAQYRDAIRRRALSQGMPRPLGAMPSPEMAEDAGLGDGLPHRERGGPVYGGIRPNLHPHGSRTPDSVDSPSVPSRRPSPISRPGRTSGLGEFYQNQNRLGLEQGAKSAIDPVSGLSQTPTEAEIQEQIALLMSKPDEGIPGYSGFDQALAMIDYYNAKQSGDPEALAAATESVMQMKNQLNALRAQSQGKTPYVVNEGGTEAFQPAGGKPVAIPGGEQVATFSTDGKVIPAGRTAQMMAQGQIDNPVLGPGVRSRDSEGNADLGTGRVYNTGPGRKSLISQYGTGSSEVPMSEGTIEEKIVPETPQQLEPNPLYKTPARQYVNDQVAKMEAERKARLLQEAESFEPVVQPEAAPETNPLAKSSVMGPSRASVYGRNMMAPWATAGEGLRNAGRGIGRAGGAIFDYLFAPQPIKK